MRTHVLLGAAVAATLALPAAASAQRFGVSAGLSDPRGELAAESGTGFNVNGMFNVTFPASVLGFRAEAGFNSFSLKGTAIGTTRIANLTGNLVVGAPGIAGFHPYLIGGMGVYRVNYSSGNKGILYPQAPSVVVGRNGSDDRMGFNAGIGAIIPLGHLGGLIEARYVALDRSGQHPSAPFIPISLGILF